MNSDHEKTNTDKIGVFDVSAVSSSMEKASIAPTQSTATTAAPVTKAPPKSFARRDHLRDIETQIQSYWNENKSFESNVDLNKPKFFLNFPYPYMNGRLHLGHAFSLTKAEFTARFQKLQGNLK